MEYRKIENCLRTRATATDGLQVVYDTQLTQRSCFKRRLSSTIRCGSSMEASRGSGSSSGTSVMRAEVVRTDAAVEQEDGLRRHRHRVDDAFMSRSSYESDSAFQAQPKPWPLTFSRSPSTGACRPGRSRCRVVAALLLPSGTCAPRAGRLSTRWQPVARMWALLRVGAPSSPPAARLVLGAEGDSVSRSARQWATSKELFASHALSLWSGAPCACASSYRCNLRNKISSDFNSIFALYSISRPTYNYKPHLQ